MSKEKNTEIAARVANIIEFEELTTNAFAMRLGYARAQTIYDIINGKSAPSCDFFSKFINAGFSERYRLEWVINGIEPMRPGVSTPPTANNTELEQLRQEVQRLKDEKIKLLEKIISLQDTH